MPDFNDRSRISRENAIADGPIRRSWAIGTERGENPRGQIAAAVRILPDLLGVSWFAGERALNWPVNEAAPRLALIPRPNGEPVELAWKRLNSAWATTAPSLRAGAMVVFLYRELEA